MTFIHFRNDFSVDISLSSKALGTTIDPDFIYSITFFTRPNGKRYKCCYNSNTLIKKDGYVTAILNNAGLECGLLKYEVEFELYSQEYPDYHKRIFQTYPSDIELVKSNGETEDIDVQQMFGTTIDDKFNSYDASILGLSTANTEIQANIVSIQELNSVQDASINRIEEMLENFDPSGSDAVQRLDTSVNALQSDVTSLNSTVDSLQADTEIIATGLTTTTNKVDDVSTRVDNMETVLGRKADVSILSNYYTKDETYNKDEVDRAIAEAAMDGSLPVGIVIDNNYVHTDNNYTNADKAKVRDFDLSLYPTNASLIENYATKAELQNVDENHPSNSSVSNNYVKKNDMSNYLSDYPTNSSVSENYATKAQVSVCIDEDDLAEILTDYPTNSSLSNNYVDWFYANETYVAYENIDEIFYNFLENSQRTENKIDEIVNDSSTIADINTNVSDVSIKVDDVSVKVKDVSLVSLDISTRLLNDYLTAQVVNRDFVKNASLNDYVLNSSLSTNYTTKDEFNEVWTTFVTADQVDETYAKIVDVSNHLTANDVSNFVTTDDISTFITEDDASVYLTANDVSNYITDASLENVWKKEGTDNNRLTLNNNIIELASNKYIKLQPDSNTWKSIFVDIFTATGNNQFPKGSVNNGINLKWTGNTSTGYSYNWGIEDIWNDSAKIGFYKRNSEYSPNQRGSLIGGIGGLVHNDSNDQSVHLYYFNLRRSDKLNDNNTYLDYYELLNSGNWQNYIDVSNYLTSDDVSNFITENDASIYLTDNDVSVYATTSYVDTQIGNIQNILQTI